MYDHVVVADIAFTTTFEPRLVFFRIESILPQNIVLRACYRRSPRDTNFLVEIDSKDPQAVVCMIYI